MPVKKSSYDAVLDRAKRVGWGNFTREFFVDEVLVLKESNHLWEMIAEVGERHCRLRAVGTQIEIVVHEADIKNKATARDIANGE